MKRKLDELCETLPSPIPSPDINAPSPEPDADFDLPDMGRGFDHVSFIFATAECAPQTLFLFVLLQLALFL